MADLLAELQRALAGMSADQRKAIDALVEEELKRAWLPNPGPQSQAYYSQADLLLYGGAAGGGKGLSLDTPIPTPSGFVSMGEIAIGDRVFDAEGVECAVTSVSEIHHRPCFELSFSDGSKLIADDQHRWVTMTADERVKALKATEAWREARKAKRPSRALEHARNKGSQANVSVMNQERVYNYNPAPTGEVRNTLEIRDTLHVRGSRVNHSIEAQGALQLPDAELPIEPYLFGLWLGDGVSVSGVICMLDEDWAHVLQHVTTPISRHNSEPTKNGQPFSYYRFVDMQTKLRLMGLLGNKHIPACYLRASIDQRLELLRGILDTDGSCDVRGQIELGLSRRVLIDDVHELLSSLGILATVQTKRLSLKNPNWADSHRLKFVSPFPAFHLPRKLQRQKLDGFRDTTQRRYITAVTPVETVPTRCIAVDSPSHTYLAGREMVPTHNTFLIVGLALEHQRTVIFRRAYSELSDIAEQFLSVIGSRNGYNGQDMRYRNGDKLVEFGALEKPGSEQSWRGRAHDLICFDEAGELAREKVQFVMGWLRSTEPGQRCRAVIASNPPTGGDGAWLMEWFAPWLDPLFADPALPGELRWCIMAGAETRWVDGPGESKLNGESYTHQSRTFVPAFLDDNPYLKHTNYRAQLQNLPEPLRSQLLKGDFLAGREDHEWQVIPSEWVRLANERWERAPIKRRPMIALAADIALGGADDTVFAPLHAECWFGPLVRRKGAELKEPAEIAALMLSLQKDGADLSVDGTGGWGSGVRSHLTTNHAIACASIVFSGVGEGKTADGKLGFKNLRAKMHWRFREALDPETGDEVMLPPDARLTAQLTAARYKIKGTDILVEDKAEIRKRLGSSTDDSDAVIMAWHRRKAALKPAASVSAPKGRLPSVGGAQNWMVR